MSRILLSEIIAQTKSRFEKSLDNRQKHKLLKYVMNLNNWEINNYDDFLQSLQGSHHSTFLSEHPLEELEKPEWKTFNLKNIPAGFALHYMGRGKIDVCNVHNNSNIKGLGSPMLTLAKSFGGNMLDNYQGFLSNLYHQNGFNDVYQKYQWDDEFAPIDWDKDYEMSQGRNPEPSVEMRQIKSQDRKYKYNKQFRKNFNNKVMKNFPGVDIVESIVLDELSKILL